jgi:hypothetical protein
MGLHETKSFWTAKETVTKLKREPTEWEKSFTSWISDKGLVKKIYRELKKLNSQRINNPMKKWEHELNRKFSKEEVQMAHKYMKKCFTSWPQKKCKSKLHWDSTSRQSKWLSSITQTTTNAGKDMGEKEHFYTVSGNVS